MKRQDKNRIVEEVSKSFSTCEAAFILSCPSMNVAKTLDIRKKLHKVGGKLLIVKNTLLRIAGEKSEPAKKMMPFFKEKISIVFAFKDPIAVATIVKDAGYGEDIFVKGGVFEGKEIESSKFLFLASIPPVKTLQANACGVLKMPIVKLVSVLQKIVEAKSNS